MTVQQAGELIEKDLEFIDIREDEERDYGYIPGSSWIPISELNSRMDELPEDQEAVLYCKNGERSGYVLTFLYNMGYDKLVQLEGGIDAWKEAGLPVLT